MPSSEASSPEYVLTEEDLRWNDYDYPEVRAARNPNPAVLRSLLQRPGWGKKAAERFAPGDTERYWKSPLTEAVKYQLPENVATLLSYGIDPTPYTAYAMSTYAKYFLRFGVVNDPGSRTREEVIWNAGQREDSPITREELLKRTEVSIFWAATGSVSLDMIPGGKGMTALEMACKGNSTEIFDMIWDAKPETSFWMRAQDDIPDPPTTSSLSVTNPLQCAIISKQNHMVQKLLSLGFDPNTMPLVARQQCLTPLMTAIDSCDWPNWEAFDMLMADPRIQRDIVTPVYKIHLTHILVAQLSLSILQRALAAGFSLQNVEKTAVQHTFLHIACLPCHVPHINIFCEEVLMSCKEVRKRPGTSNMVTFRDGQPEPAPTDYFDSQLELVRFLLTQTDDPNGLIDEIDIHGNTAMHYLACYRAPNEALIDFLVSYSQSARDTWQSCQNRAGFTPTELLQFNQQAIPEKKKPFWKRSYTTEWRPGGREPRVIR